MVCDLIFKFELASHQFVFMKTNGKRGKMQVININLLLFSPVNGVCQFKDEVPFDLSHANTLNTNTSKEFDFQLPK